MIVVYVAIGFESCLLDAAACSSRRAGCDVVVIGGREVTEVESLHTEPIGNYWSGAKAAKAAILAHVPGAQPNHLMPMLRWFVVRDYLEDKKIDGHVMVPDWDVTITGSIADAISTFSRDDVYTGPGMAAYGFRDRAILRAFCDFVMSLYSGKSPAVGPNFNDRIAWQLFCKTFGFSQAVPHRVINGAVFDANMTLSTHSEGYRLDGMEVFSMEGGCKQIVWKDMDPYFVLSHDGDLVRAVWIHCWGPAKQKLSEIAKRSGSLNEKPDLSLRPKNHAVSMRSGMAGMYPNAKMKRQTP